jgi:hypothetical protein
MEKAWEIEFSCGMVGCDKESFMTDILPKMTKNELIYVLSESSEIYEKLKNEYKKRYTNG